MRDDLWVWWYLMKRRVRNMWLYYLLAMVISFAMFFMMLAVVNLIFSFFPNLIKIFF